MTLTSTETVLAAYLGYLVNICGQTPTWEDCFDVTRLRAFVLWHGVRVGRPISATGWHLACKLAAMAVVLELSQARALAEFRQQLPPLTPLHIKRLHWVSLATLEAIATECLVEGRGPCIVDPRTRNSGVRRALQFQKGVMLKLLVRAPLRQRNVRELRLDQHLYKDEVGHWHLHFAGDDLKIGTRGGRINEYNLDLSADTDGLVPVLEEFLRDYRPRLPNATTSPFLFLMQSGKPYERHSLYQELSRVVAMRTGQRFYPHLIRSIWATAYLEKYQDFTTAAVLLGDTVGTVMKTYYDVVNKDHHAKAKAFLSTALRTG